MEKQRVQQQKELQQQRNEKRLLQALMKSEERQNQMEEFLLKSVNGTKTSENDITMYSIIETFEYVPENDKTFDAFYRRYEDVFNVDCKEWSNEKRYVYYPGNWVQLNTVGSLILSFKKKAAKNNGSGVLRNS